MEKVIFDTNAYRYLATGKTNRQLDKVLKKIKHREQQNGIESLLNPIVAKELLAHIANRNDPSFKKCLMAIKALYYHNGNNSNYSMIPSPELLVSKAFFQKIIDRKLETNKAFGQMVFHFAKNPNQYVFKKFQRNLNLNAQDVSSVEKAFADEMKKFLKILDPNAQDWNAFQDDAAGRQKALLEIRSDNTSIQIATGFLFIVRELLVLEGKVDKKDYAQSIIDLRPVAESFIKVFPEPIALYKSVMENMVNSEFNLYEKNRTNFIWDIQMMYYVGQNSIGNLKIIFVTSDKAMIENALSTNPRNVVLTFDEYMEYLGLK